MEAGRDWMAGYRARHPAAARERRPFARRGAAVRSEMCVHCTDQGVDDETSYLLHSDPELNVPVTPPPAQPAPVPDDSGRKRALGIERLTAAGFSRETAEYAYEPVIYR
jgi:hypothetical protein